MGAPGSRKRRERRAASRARGEDGGSGRLMDVGADFWTCGEAEASGLLGRDSVWLLPGGKLWLWRIDLCYDRLRRWF